MNDEFCNDFDNHNIKDFNSDNLDKVRDLENLIQNKQKKLKEVEIDIKSAEDKFNMLKHHNIENQDNFKNNLLNELQIQKERYRQDYEDMTKRLQNDYAEKRKEFQDENLKFNI